MKISVLSIAALTSTPLAAIGDKCRSKEGSGTCKRVTSCTSGFTVTDACPHDGPDIKCYISKDCNQGGHCYDKNHNSCSGGHFVQNLCPGPSNVQCCIRSGGGGSTPSAPSNCPAVRKVSRLGPDDVIFSRQGTKKAYTLYKGAEHVLDMCTIAGGVLGGGYGGIPRGLRVSGRISWQTMQMSVQEKTSA